MRRRPLRASQAVRLKAKELRQVATTAEQALWARLRSRQVDGLKFRRQHPLGRCIADFYCAEARLIVEVDGGIHEVQRDHDADRTAYLEALGHRVIRFRNEDVLAHVEDVLAVIAAVARERQREIEERSGEDDSSYV